MQLQSVLTSLICFVVALFIYYYQHLFDGNAICEIGYHSSTKKSNSIGYKSFFDSILYYNLCQNAKKNKKIVWLYFGLNILVLLSVVVSLILCVAMFFADQWNDVILVNFGYLFSELFLHTLLRFGFDLVYLPSEKKRYKR